MLIDFTTNKYGHVLIDFLINCNLCMLNGRNNTANDFTSISSRGCSVVDYCLVGYEKLDIFQDFRVRRSTELIDENVVANNLAPTSIPDHSCLLWNIVTPQVADGIDHSSHPDLPTQAQVKYDASVIPDSFLLDPSVLNEVQAVIGRLESSFRVQSDIDQAYTDFCSVVTNEMQSKLPCKTKTSYGSSNKRRRVGKPWWSPDLTILWNKVCESERIWLHCNIPQERSRYKQMFVAARKQFVIAVQRAKRKRWAILQENMLLNLNADSKTFWRDIGRVGVADTRSKDIPMEAVLDDGTVTYDKSQVLEKWRQDFSSLYNDTSDIACVDGQISPQAVSDSYGIYEPISILEVDKAVVDAKKGKATGTDAIPCEVLKNPSAIGFLHSLFNVCFSTGTIPAEWGKGIINPIPKSSTADRRDPLSYRGITLANSMYKLYCHILNARLTEWAEKNKIVADEQNGFRKNRSTIDHLSSLTGIIDTRKKLKLPTFCAFIDFKKAYDSVNRDLMWGKLESLGLNGPMLTALKSLYHSVSSCVRINQCFTDWFGVSSGLRQGCSISPILFNLFINDLAFKIKALGKGIKVGDDMVSILLYADDVVLLASCATDLQAMLDSVSDWCSNNRLLINPKKSNIVHFRPPSHHKSVVNFKCCNENIAIVDNYKYLGLVLNEFLDMNLTAKMVAQSASRALGLLIAKFKTLGGMPYSVFTKLYDSLVWPVISYGTAVWGDRTYSCINAVQNRAMRFFLGTGKYTPVAAVSGDMGWTQPLTRQWQRVSLHWHRLSCMDDNRLNKRIFTWCKNKGRSACKNWCYSVKCMFQSLDLSPLYVECINVSAKVLANEVTKGLTVRHMYEWQMNIDKEIGNSGRGKNKLRSYRMFKRFYDTEQYCSLNIPISHRAAYAKFRCGVAPLRIETGRYSNLPVQDRVCPFCPMTVEDEIHVLFKCQKYESQRVALVAKANELGYNLAQLSDNEKLTLLFSTNSLVRVVAKTCYLILKYRKSLLYT